MLVGKRLRAKRQPVAHPRRLPAANPRTDAVRGTRALRRGVYATRNAADWAADRSGAGATSCALLAAQATVGASRRRELPFRGHAAPDRPALPGRRKTRVTLTLPPVSTWERRAARPASSSTPRHVPKEQRTTPLRHPAHHARPHRRGSGPDAPVHGRGRGGGLRPARGEANQEKAEGNPRRLPALARDKAGPPGARVRRRAGRVAARVGRPGGLRPVRPGPAGAAGRRSACRRPPSGSTSSGPGRTWSPRPTAC